SGDADLVELSVVLCVFVFQAEDGIRDWSVTGVQTCALPISCCSSGAGRRRGWPKPADARKRPSATWHAGRPLTLPTPLARNWSRSEERRVGKRVDLGG